MSHLLHPKTTLKPSSLTLKCEPNKDKKMKGNSLKPFSFYKHNSLFVKLVLLFFLLGIVIHFFPSYSIDYTSLQAHNSYSKNVINSQETNILAFSKGSDPPNELNKDEANPQCDLLKGDWVPNPSGPVYNNYTCPFIEPPQNCLSNGRPDSGYLYWRWKPRGCDLPKFNPERFLDSMRSKSWAFIGDSISRNHFQSVLCVLSKVEIPKEVYHDEQYKSRTWIFPSYNFTMAVIWSPFLVKANIFEDNNGFSTSEIELHLDQIDEKWTRRYKDFDYAIIGGGKWFLKTAIYYENSTVQGCHYCPGKNLTELGFEYAYRKALEQVFNFVLSSSHKVQVFFRTITPDHFENGEWHNGGTCPRRVPFKEGEVNITVVDSILHEVELGEFDKASIVASRKSIPLELLDTTQMSLMRPDGHAGPYRQPYPFAKDKNAKVQNDCLHWCLPGPIDSWNDLMMEMLMNR